MNPISQILWEAAADVEQKGVCRKPQGSTNEVCALTALYQRDWGRGGLAARIIEWGVGEGVWLGDWNDRQPSRAVVAAAMRDAAFLAEWAGPHLLGGSK